MPGGSEYPGSPDDLARYRALVERHGIAEVLGAKNPYTSRNGWMTSFVDPTGLICFRLSAGGRDELIAEGGAAVQQYGKNMPDFASAPGDADEPSLDRWFGVSWEHAGSLPPK